MYPVDTLLIVSTQEHHGLRSRIALHTLQYRGIAAVREAMHARALASRPGGSVFEPGRGRTEGWVRPWDEFVWPFRVLGF